MNITELREEIATNFLREPSRTKRLNKTYEVLDGIDHKRPFCYVASGMNHVEAFQLPKTITSPRLDEIITNIEKQQEGMWYYYDGKTEPQRVAYESILASFKQIRDKYYGNR